MWHPVGRVATSADFKATVASALERPGDSRIPRQGEILLLGTTAGGSWVRLKIPRRYRWFASPMVRGFVREKGIDRLAIAVVADPSQPRQMLVAFTGREAVSDVVGISDPTLARLVAAATREWSGVAKRTFKVLGRPWPVALLVVALSLELVPALLDAPRDRLPADAVDFAVIALTAATAVLLWSQTRVGYSLALALSAVQFVWPIVFYGSSIPSRGLGTVAVWLLWSWSYPALIWFLLWLLYLDRRRTS